MTAPASIPIPALVLAGGAARRFGGGDKPLAGIGGRTMLDLILNRLRAEGVGTIALSANGDPARFARFGLPVLADGAFAGAGPLAGVLVGLDWAERIGAAALLTVPGDTPFLPAGLLRGLGAPPAVAGDRDGRVHPLLALWPVAARAALRAALGAGRRQVGAFAAGLGARVVVFSAAPAEAFLNVNTAADLARAQRLAAARCPGEGSR